MFEPIVNQWDYTTHTANNPYCADRDCSCHTCVEYHSVATSTLYASSEQIEQALQFFGVRVQGGIAA